MSNRNMYIALAIAVAIAVFSAVFLMGGRRPVVYVNGVSITAGEIQKGVDMVGSYYYNLRRGLSGAGVASGEVLSNGEIRLSVLNSIIENELIRSYLHKELNEKLVNEMVVDAIRGVETENPNIDFRGAISSFYNDSYENVLNVVLIPQARRDILASHLFLEGEEPEPFLEELRREADVRILEPGLSWDAGTGQVVLD